MTHANPVSPPTDVGISGLDWLHTKSGGIYRAETVALCEADLTPVVVYRGADGIAWTRPLAEFLDGRFKPVPHAVYIDTSMMSPDEIRAAFSAPSKAELQAGVSPLEGGYSPRPPMTPTASASAIVEIIFGIMEQKTALLIERNALRNERDAHERAAQEWSEDARQSRHLLDEAKAESTARARRILKLESALLRFSTRVTVDAKGHHSVNGTAEYSDYLAAYRAIASANSSSLQARVYEWAKACFGDAAAQDSTERNHRYLEEALELVQANGCTQSEAHQLVDYVFGRPIGETRQEVGGTLLTLAALCAAIGIDMDEAGEAELARVWTKFDQIRAKQAAKPKHSPLPGPSNQEGE